MYYQSINPCVTEPTAFDWARSDLTGNLTGTYQQCVVLPRHTSQLVLFPQLLVDFFLFVRGGGGDGGGSATADVLKGIILLGIMYRNVVKRGDNISRGHQEGLASLFTCSSMAISRCILRSVASFATISFNTSSSRILFLNAISAEIKGRKPSILATLATLRASSFSYIRWPK